MHPTRPQQSIINELTGHASLLLSNTQPTIINSSPLQNNTNNTSTQAISSTTTNNTLTVNFSDDDLTPDDSINFKKPQNEIFKTLDSKIQKIVAAHSNLNKLYALNDFSRVAPRKPFELPPQLPRPPPWVPKVSSDYGCSQWAEETLNNLNRMQPIEMEDNPRPRLAIPGANRVTKIGPKMEITAVPGKQTPPTLDSAISRLHQRRNLEHNPQLQKVLLRPVNKTQSMPPKLQVPQPQPRISQQAQRIHQLNIRPQQGNSPARELFPGPSRSTSNLAQFSSKDIGALNALIKAQKQQQLQQRVSPSKESTGPTSIKPNLTPDERRKFQTELINIFRQEIAAVAKLAKLKFQSPRRNEGNKLADQSSLLLKKSPQSLFNTIRRETSLLLTRRDPNRSGTSLLSEQQLANRLNYGQQNAFRPFNRFQPMKVVVPPSEHFKHVCGKQPGGKEGSENLDCKCFESKAQSLGIDEWCPSQQFMVDYSKLQKKLCRLRYVQRKDELNRHRGITVSMSPADARKRPNNPQKSLDNIVGRLQAKCMSTSTSSSPVNPDSQDQSSRISSPAPEPPRAPTQRLEMFSAPLSPKPIPVFRSLTNKGGFISGSAINSNQRVVNLKSKKAKRLHHFGLRLGNYMEKDSGQTTIEKITVEQFAKCLNLVRTNDASLKRHQDRLKQSESRWRMPISDRPLRLRRIRGERIHMPASASYRASRSVGLQ